MNVLRPPVKTIARELAAVYGEDNVTILHGILGNSVQIKCPQPDMWAVLGFSRRVERPYYDLYFYCRPSDRWLFDDTDPIKTNREITEADYANITTKQLIKKVTEVIG